MFTILFKLISFLSKFTSPLLRKLLSKKTLLVVASQGGHLTEARVCIPKDTDKQIIFATSKNQLTVDLLEGQKHFFLQDPLTNAFLYIINFFQSIRLFILSRPSYILSSGANIAMFSLIFGKLSGAKIIFLESGARIYKPSRSGRAAYQISDLFLIQSSHLRAWFPKSKLVSLFESKT